MRHAVYDRMLQHMRERTVTDIVQQNSDHCRCLFLLRDLHIF